MSSEVSTLSRLRIWSTRPRWARIVQQMIKEKTSERKDEPFVSEGGDVVRSDEDHSEEKAFKEKENLEQKAKQKVCGESFTAAHLSL